MDDEEDARGDRDVILAKGAGKPTGPMPWPTARGRRTAY